MHISFAELCPFVLILKFTAENLEQVDFKRSTSLEEFNSLCTFVNYIKKYYKNYWLKIVRSLKKIKFFSKSLNYLKKVIKANLYL